MEIYIYDETFLIWQLRHWYLTKCLAFWLNCFCIKLDFTGSGISTHTLDSGIGTFPLPDYSVNAGCKSVPKGKAQGENDPLFPQGRHGSGIKIPHKAWTLERELSSLEEDYIMGQDSTQLEGKLVPSQVADTGQEGTDYLLAHCFFFVFF